MASMDLPLLFFSGGRLRPVVRHKPRVVFMHRIIITLWTGFPLYIYILHAQCVLYTECIIFILHVCTLYGEYFMMILRETLKKKTGMNRSGWPLQGGGHPLICLTASICENFRTFFPLNMIPWYPKQILLHCEEAEKCIFDVFLLPV